MGGEKTAARDKEPGRDEATTRDEVTERKDARVKKDAPMWLLNETKQKFENEIFKFCTGILVVIKNYYAGRLCM